MNDKRSQFTVVNDIINDKRDHNSVNDIELTALLISQTAYLLFYETGWGGQQIYNNWWNSWIHIWHILFLSLPHLNVNTKYGFSSSFYLGREMT